MSLREGLRSRMTVTRQMRSGESQSEQTPVLAQGVFLFRRMVLPGKIRGHTRMALT